MQKMIKNKVALGLALIMLLTLSACKRNEPNPYEGMVSVPNGAGGEMWVPLYDDVEVSTLKGEEFRFEDGRVSYIGQGLKAVYGIDVSEHQAEIDWLAVKEDGIDFAIIRAGYRGYSEGKLFEDAYFKANIEGAISAGIKVGVYFFSQAINAAEGREEARFLLDIIDGYELNLPVFFDWENISYTQEARTDGLDRETLTQSCLAFCEEVEKAGREAGVYFYRSLGYLNYNLQELTGLDFWAAAPGEIPDFYYKHRLWQYSYTGQVEGISGDTDLNILFEELPQPGE